MPNESLVININLIKGRYEAGGWDDPSVAEWPPHPARVFCALVASARCEDDYDVLRWLEKQPPPVVQAARDFDDEHRKSYVVVNENLGYADLKAKRKKKQSIISSTYYGDTNPPFSCSHKSACSDCVV
jgi:CRISPR-associated protein Csb2